MKMMVSSYNNGASDWNAEAEETAFRSYTLDHAFNGPAKCTIVLADPTGAIMRKYDTDANDVYLGVGKVITSDEAREIVNESGGDLPLPGPDFTPEGAPMNGETPNA